MQEGKESSSSNQSKLEGKDMYSRIVNRLALEAQDSKG